MSEFDESEVSKKLQEAVMKVLEETLCAYDYNALVNETEIEGMVRDQANDLTNAVLDELEEL